MRSGALDLSDLLTDIQPSDVKCPDLSDIGPRPSSAKDLFAEKKRAGWNKVQTEDARCDFAPNRLRITNRGGVVFTSLWKKSVYGRTLTDIKADPDMVATFADALVPLIRSVIGSFLSPDIFAVVTTPKRRHRERNFATLVADRIAQALGLPFYEDCAECRTKQRTGAVFTAHNLPPHPHIIVIDDFVTTGQTFVSMQNLLLEHRKNCVFFAGINNKL